MNSNWVMDGMGGGLKQTDIICTIDSGIAMWHTLILEEYEDRQSGDPWVDREQTPSEDGS